jgi:hypothetical protein
MATPWVGHTTFSRDASRLSDSQLNSALSNGHTKYSLGLDTRTSCDSASDSCARSASERKRDPSFVAAFSGKIKDMDDRHAELYLFGDHSDDFKVDRGGINTSNWVCPWQPSPASRVDGFVKFAGLTDRDVVVDIGCGDGRVVSQ